ncbi:uncharacterized protein STEHIDRAFT_119981 [Stereum hirsutum FP-91666 SS1]|uniref:uncharacterized protein n=1 Tax=Stereum hirsutum (strain FP-91666) TaxID=721885 RepID=UPI000440A3F2|nr:uncharacterized protein STEHIDRAFT_119981 [Stereum hirsutum FP-91666 SS1]EIM89308.1 hypothetical protein STEHIDRAFT_119981 [Stereum hirsutum FP-91666 SS1]
MTVRNNLPPPKLKTHGPPMPNDRLIINIHPPPTGKALRHKAAAQLAWVPLGKI